MPRRSSDGLPGSVYAKGGYLYVKIPGAKVIATGLTDTKANRIIAGRVKRDKYVETLLPTKQTPQSVTFHKGWERFAKLHDELEDNTLTAYAHAFFRIATDRSIEVTTESIEAFALAFKANRSGKPHTRATGKVKDVTVASYLIQYNIVCKWICKDSHIPMPDLTTLLPKRQGEHIPQTFTRNEIHTLINAGHTLSPQTEFMVLTGARPIDALTLDKKDLLPKVQGIRWTNKITKQPEPRPVSSRAWALAQKHVPFPDYAGFRSMARTFQRFQRDEGIESGRSMKHLRTTFLVRIDSLPWHIQVWLMRHHPTGVTERSYKVYEWEPVIKLLDNLEW